MQGEMLQHEQKAPVICADVDGTILATDLLYESFLYVLKRHPLTLFRAPWWLLKGRAHLKEKLAERAEGLSVDLLPLNEGVVDYLRQAAGEGQRIVLASASHRSMVERVAKRLGFVSDVIATDGTVNFKGSAKAKAINAHLGDVAWEYVGDSSADLAVWREASSVVCVTSSVSFGRRVQAACPGAHLISKPAFTPAVLLKALRVHQWLKNLLLFAPIVLAHQWLNGAALRDTVLAALAFSLCASGVYLMNDLLDLEADRLHPRKRKRPCAAGRMPLATAMALTPALFAISFGIAATVNLGLLVVLSIYLLLTSAYSFRLKALALVDIILLAFLYTMRVVAGGVAANIHLSQWLLGLSMFLFLSLACVKRFSELLVLQQRNESRTWGRGYSVGDIEQIASFGSASAYISVLVLALYVSSKEIAELYSTPEVVYFACPLLLYWVSRIWLLARRGLVHDDPLVFALRDKITYVVAAIGVIIFVGAKW
jgi:4-hydroxybenzoate polyprenyltransferase/phosphoserine phosphatase